MNLKKLSPNLVKAMAELGFDEEPREIQSLTIPKIKSGADLIAIAPEGSGKTTAIAMAVVQQLKAAVDIAPRAIIVVSTRENAFAMDKEFELLAKFTNLRSLAVYDQGNLAYQKDMIYEGIDVLITTPRRLGELMNNTGVPLVSVKIIFIDDGETIFQGQNHTLMHRVADGMNKAQFIIFSNVWNDKFEVLAERIMKNPTIIEIE